MVQATESKYFKDQKARSMNYTVNSKEEWKPEQSELIKISLACERVENDLNTGILTKKKLLRTRELQ